MQSSNTKSKPYSRPSENKLAPLQIEVVEGTRDEPPEIRVGQYVHSAPRLVKRNAETFYHMKDQILRVNGLPAFDYRMYESMQSFASKKEKSDFYGRIKRAQHKHYATYLGPKFNARFYKIHRGVFYAPFHPRVTRLMGGGIRAGVDRVINRQDQLSASGYIWCWRNKAVLNETAVSAPNILPIIMLLRIETGISGYLGDGIWEVIEVNSARRNEDIANILRLVLTDSGQQVAYNELLQPLLHLLICMPSYALRMMAKFPGRYLGIIPALLTAHRNDKHRERLVIELMKADMDAMNVAF